MLDQAKQWIALTLVGVLAVLAAGWFLLVSPKRSEAADVRAQVTAQQATNHGLDAQLAVLKAQAKALPAQQAQLAAVAAKIPDNPALPSLVRSLSKAAADAGVELFSLQPTTPLAEKGSAAAAPPVASTPVAPGAAPAAPASTVSIGQLQSMTLSLNVVGGYFQVESFLDKLENLTRAFKVTTLALSPGTNPVKVVDPNAPVVNAPQAGTLMAVITGKVYLAVGRTTTAAPAK